MSNTTQGTLNISKAAYQLDAIYEKYKKSLKKIDTEFSLNFEEIVQEAEDVVRQTADGDKLKKILQHKINFIEMAMKRLQAYLSIVAAMIVAPGLGISIVNSFIPEANFSNYQLFTFLVVTLVVLALFIVRYFDNAYREQPKLVFYQTVMALLPDAVAGTAAAAPDATPLDTQKE